MSQGSPRASSTDRGAKTTGREPAHVAHRQPKTVPEEPEEQRVDLLQVVSEPNLRWSNACLNFHHFDSQSAGYLERVMATTTENPRLFEISNTMTLRDGYLKRVIDTIRAIIITFLNSWRGFDGNCNPILILRRRHDYNQFFIFLFFISSVSRCAPVSMYIGIGKFPFPYI